MANCLPDLSLMKGPLSTTYYINNLLHLGRIIAKFVIFALASPCSPFHQIRHFPRGHLWHPTWIFVKPMVNFGQIHHFCQILHSVNFSSLQGAPLVILLKLSSALRRFFAIAGCFHYFAFFLPDMLFSPLCTFLDISEVTIIDIICIPVH